MSDLRKAAQQALEALELLDRVMQRSPRTDAAITDLRAALEGSKPELVAFDWLHQWAIQNARKPEPCFMQEPVAYVYHHPKLDGASHHRCSLIWNPEFMDARSADKGPRADVLYIAPPQRKPLTDEDIYAAIKGIDSLKAVEVARAIEKAHGIT